MTTDDLAGKVEKRRLRLDRAIVEQRAHLHRVADPDNRERAEENLVELALMRAQLAPDLPSEIDQASRDRR